METVTLPDGHNGHTEVFYAEPIARMGDTVKLRCASIPGCSKWVYEAELAEALLCQQKAGML